MGPNGFQESPTSFGLKQAEATASADHEFSLREHAHAELERAPLHAKASEAEEELPEVPLLSPTGTIQVSLQDARTGEPVVGQVWTYPVPDYGPSLALTKLRADGLRPWELGRRLGHGGSTDAQGRIQLPKFGERQTVVARSGDLFAWAPKFQKDHGYLSLNPDQTANLRILDHEGHGLADVPVGVADTRGKATLLHWDSLSRTDAEGFVTVPHLQRWRTPENAESLVVRPFLPLANPPYLSVKDWLESMTPTTLALPPLGALKVEIVDWEGKPINGICDVQLVIDPIFSAGEERRTLRGFKSDSGIFHAWCENGMATFPMVDLGQTFGAQAWEADPMNCTIGEAPGPSVEGQTAVLTLRPTLEATSLELRLVDEHGQPLSSVDVEVLFSKPNLFTDKHAYRTEEDGRLRLVLDIKRHKELETSKRLFLRHRDPGEKIYRKTELLVENLAPGPHDLGDVSLHPAEGVLSGQVVDQGGKAIGGANLTIQEASPDSMGEFWITARSDDQGYFIESLEDAPEEILLIVGADGYTSQTIHLGNRSSNQLITLQPEWLLAGRILPPDGVSVEEITLLFHDEGEPRVYTTTPRGDGSFLIERLPEGSGDLDIRWHNSSNSLHRVEGVRVGKEGDPIDPRLDPLDLSTLVPSATVIVTNERGEPLKGVSLYPLHGRGRYSNARTDAQGRLAVPVLREGKHMVLARRSYRPHLFELRSGDHEVTLETGLRVHVQLQPVPQLPHGVTMGGAISRIDPLIDARIGSERFTLSSSGEADIRLPSHGDYNVSLWLHRDEIMLGFLKDWDSNSPVNTVPFDADSKDATITIPIDLSQVEALLKKE